MKMANHFCFLIFLWIFTSLQCGVTPVRHARNLIWAQTPSLKIGVSRIVGIEGDPTEWVPSGNVQVRHISAPHHGWQFKALAYNYATQTLFWSESTNKKIQSLRLNGTTETDTVFTGTSSAAEGLAIDWMSNNIYWTDSLYNWIVMAPLTSQEPVYRLVVRDGLSDPHGIAVHPQKGYLFWTDTGAVSKIECSDLLGDHRITIIDTDIQQPRGLTIDYSEEMLYWVDSKKDTIEAAGFLGNNRRVVAHQPATIFFGVAVFQKYIFVTEQMQGHLRVYDKKTGNNEINYQLGYIPDGIIMYDDTLQAGNTNQNDLYDMALLRLGYVYIRHVVTTCSQKLESEYLRADCEEKGCQQICINDPLYGPKCRCGDGYILNVDDQTSCTPGRKFVMPSHIYAIGDAICQYPVNLPDMSLYNVTLESQCFLQRGRGNFGLTFDAREHMLYYTENITKSIGRISLEIGETGTTIIKGVGDVQGLALDWVTGNLFWTDQTYNHISVSRKDGMYPTVLIENLDTPLGIVVHPERGQMFWTEHGKTRMIFTAYMDGSQKRALLNESQCDMPNHLFLDYKTDKLYWADSGFYSIRSYDLKTGGVEVVYEQIREQVSFFGLSIYQDYLLWTDKNDQKNGIHAARLDKLEKVRGILHPHIGLASDLITFDIHNQPDFSSACSIDNGFCEHLCVPTSNETYICTCGVGYTLDDNLRTCSSSLKTDNYVVTVDSYQKQIYQVEVDTGEVSAIPLANSYKGVAIDINRFTSTLYWSDNQDHVIMKAQIDGAGEEVFRALPNGSISDGIAVDSINQLLFYTCTYQDIIVVVSLRNKGIYKTIINDSLDEPRDIIVHSEKGMIYWTDWGAEPKIESATMAGGNRSVIMRMQNDSWPNALALDADTMNLFWVDARHEVIGRINLGTGVKKILYTEPRAHFFGMTLMGGHLYITDWFRKHISRLRMDGDTLEQVGPAKFSRLNGIAGYKKSDIKTAFSRCLASTCSHLCLPVSGKDYVCACADDGKYNDIPCSEMNEIDFHHSARTSHLKNRRDGSPALTIALSVVGVIAVLVLAFGAVYFYNKKFRGQITHDRLVEDTSKVDTFYRITFPDPTREEANFDSGIENPSFECSVEDVTSGGNIVRYSPM